MKSTVLITGGSRGIGLELSKLFAKDGYDIVLVARDKQKLDETKIYLEAKFNIKVYTIVEDLCDINACHRIKEKLDNENIDIDVLVNNAGFGVYREFRDTDLDKELDMIRVNILALVSLTKIFLKDMISKNRRGKIVNMSSAAAFQPVPLLNIYAATKAFVLSFSQALKYELKDTNISVTAICPGPVDTDFKKTADMDDSNNFKNHMLDVSVVARKAYLAINKNKMVYIPGLWTKILIFFSRLAPRNIVMFFAKMQVKEKK